MPSVISIVIPTYGRDGVLCDMVASLLALAERAEELLVIDQTPEHDEETTERLTGWDREGDIRWIRHQPPGVVGAMNRGLREAKGDIVLFLDDDIVPDVNLVAAHRQAHIAHHEAWAVVGQVMQPEDCRPQTGDRRLKTEENRPQKSQKNTEEDCLTANLANYANLSQVQFYGEESQQAVSHSFLIRIIRKNRGSRSPASALRRDLDFRFNGTAPAWVENVMAGNLSVRRDKAIALGGFDDNFIPPVSYRFETEFAKRTVLAGGRIRFEPKATIRHLRVASGGTRSKGGHLTSASPLHGVGDYYYALKCGEGLERMRYMLCRPFREVCTTFHLRHPWWIPVKLMGELRALVLALRSYRNGKHIKT